MRLGRLLACGLVASISACGQSDRQRDDAGPGPDVAEPDLTSPSEDGPSGQDGSPLFGYIYAHNAAKLYRIDARALGSASPRPPEEVGAFFPVAGSPGEDMTDLAVTPDDHIYGLSWTKLWEIAPDTGQATFVVDVPGATNVALTFDKDGTLLGSDKDGNLRRIDPKKGTVTPIGNAGPGFRIAGDIVGVADGTLFETIEAGAGADASNNGLVRIDPANGMATFIGLTGFDNLWGLAYWCGKVYGLESEGAIIQIDVQTGMGTKILDTDVNWWGAGVTPRAPLGTAGGCG